MPIFTRRRPPPPSEVAEDAVKVAARRLTLDEVDPARRGAVKEALDALDLGLGVAKASPAAGGRARPVSAQAIAARAGAALGPSSAVTPEHIELAMRRQGLDWVQPFAPGAPLVPYYGYGRQPRTYDYNIGRNITTETRPDRIPFDTLEQLYTSYDVAQICVRHAINDLRSMRVRFEAADGYEQNPVKEIAEAKRFLRRPDGQRTMGGWLAANARDLWVYDSNPIFRQRDKAGNLIGLISVDAKTIAPMLDYYGRIPHGDAPAFQQFIQGVPWDWLTWDDIIYQPMWPQTDSPYGTPPLETVLINANTDVRLQMYFLDFFTKGQVPEAFAIAPEDQSDATSLAELQETYDDWTYADNSQRWGLRWLPAGTVISPYKPSEFDPDLAEYVMRRTCAAFMMVPSDLGFTADVNRASGDTQMDVQFRINSLPHVAYYEDLLSTVLQEDKGLPVQVRFDTGREKEDRLMEAQAHQIYVSIGAESPSEVREKVLGHPVDPEQRIPLFFDSMRLGPVPMEYLLSVAGKVDPLTLMPDASSVVPREFVVPGMMAPDPPIGARPKAGDDKAAQAGQGAPPKGPARKGAVAFSGESDETEDAEAEAQAATAGPGEPGYGVAAEVEVLEGEAAAELRKWRAKAKKRLKAGRGLPAFEAVALPPERIAGLRARLAVAASAEEADEAFAKARVGWRDFHRYTDHLATEFEPRVASALGAVYSDDTLRQFASMVEREAGALAKATQAANATIRQAAAGAPAPGAPVAPLNPGAAAAVGVAAGGLGTAAVGVGIGASAVPLGSGALAAGAALTHWLATRARDTAALSEVLADIYASGYLAGAGEAADAASGSLPSWLSAVPGARGWKPGDHAAVSSARLLAQGRLAVLLAQERPEWVREIITTYTKRLGQVVLGVLSGEIPLSELWRRLREVARNAAHAWLIAETELSRAIHAGMQDTYEANGIAMVAWVHLPGACARCMVNAAASPLPVGRPWPEGSVPVHARCRCIEVPYTAPPPRRTDQ